MSVMVVARTWKEQSLTVGRRVAVAGGLGLLTVVLLRLPLWLLPGPGRDEAAYHYWVHHAEPAYAPLMQMVVKLFELPLHQSLWALRGPVIVTGLLVLLLGDLRLRWAGAAPSARLLAFLAVALTPWQSVTGSFLHPDGFLMVALLAFVLAAQRDRVLLSALAAVAAVLAKPTGVLLVPVAWWLVGRLDASERWRVVAARALLGAVSLAFLLSMKAAMVEGMADFARAADSVSLPARLGSGGLSLIFTGGPLLLALAVPGFRERLRLLRRGESGSRRREAEASLAAAAVLLVFFLAAALLRGQVKGNWIMPALVLLLPVAPVKVPRAVLVASLVFTFAASLGQTVAMRQPRLTAWADAGYSVHAGIRETAVSPTRTWQHHLAQYGDASGFARDIRQGWRDVVGMDTPLAWIVSDDYGLAAQLHWYLGHDTVRLVLPRDGVFHRTVAPLLTDADPGPLLVLTTNVTAEELWNRLEIVGTLPGVRHPVTEETLVPRVARLARPQLDDVPWEDDREIAAILPR